MSSDEALIADYAKLADTPPWKLLSGYLDGSLPAPRDAGLANMLAQGKRWYDDTGAAGELQDLLSALAGEHRPTSLRRRSDEKPGCPAHRAQFIWLRSFAGAHQGRVAGQQKKPRRR